MQGIVNIINIEVKGTATGDGNNGGPGFGVNNLLLEDGFNILLEDGTSVLLLES